MYELHFVGLYANERVKLRLILSESFDKYLFQNEDLQILQFFFDANVWNYEIFWAKRNIIISLYTDGKYRTRQTIKYSNSGREVSTVKTCRTYSSSTFSELECANIVA